MSDKLQPTGSPSKEAAEEFLKEKIAEIMKSYLERVSENVNRVTGMIRLYMSLKKNVQFFSMAAVDDILRASVVYTHATLEDFLRTMGTRLLPEADEQVLNRIPLADLKSSTRGEKFFLGRLKQFKGKTVDEVIMESVRAHFEQSNFNSVDDIAKLLDSLGIELSGVKQHFSRLAELMVRRHFIVHRADRTEQIDSSERVLQSIDADIVVGWLETVVQFISDVLPRTTVQHLFKDGHIKIEGDGIKVKLRNK